MTYVEIRVRKASIVNEISSGSDPREVAKRYGVAFNTVSGYCYKSGLKLSGSRFERVHRTCRDGRCLNPEHLFANEHMDGDKKYRRSGMTTDESIDWPLSKCEKQDNGCLLSLSGRKSKKYPHIKLGRKDILLHRLVLERKLGHKLPDGILACHKCDTPRCVNPDHLFPGTQAENFAAMMSKNRQARNKWEKNWTAKLTSRNVLEIRDLASSQLFKKQEIANLYGVSRRLIDAINTRKLWSHLA